MEITYNNIHNFELIVTYADKHEIILNPSKSKLLCFNTDSSSIAPIYLNGQKIPVVQQDKHLDKYISSDIHDRNINGYVCEFY